MPNCFQLFKKSNSIEPVAFDIIDVEICKLFDAPVHKTYWHIGWYDYIGPMLAMGKDFEWLKREGEKDITESVNDKEHWTKMLVIIRYLADNYTHKAWYQSKV